MNKNGKYTTLLFLGACPALAATASVQASLAIAIATVAVLVISGLLLAVLRLLCKQESLTVTLITTAFASSLVQMLMAAFLPKYYAMLGIYVAVCAMNAMIAEAAPSVKKTVTTAVLYAALVIIMGMIREVLGAGTLMSVEVPFFSTHYVNVFAKAPGAFLVFSILLALANACEKEVN